MIDELLRQRLADDLIGTSGAYDETFADAYNVQPADLHEVVAEYACSCEQCGWWVDVSECNEDGICEDCAIYD